jgi:hypothetical protein
MVEKVDEEHLKRHEEIGELRMEQKSLVQKFQNFETSYRDNLNRIYLKLDRPSWMVAGAITFLCSAVVALLTIVLTR